MKKAPLNKNKLQVKDAFPLLTNTLLRTKNIAPGISLLVIWWLLSTTINRGSTGGKTPGAREKKQRWLGVGGPYVTCIFKRAGFVFKRISRETIRGRALENFALLDLTENLFGLSRVTLAALLSTGQKESTLKILIYLLLLLKTISPELVGGPEWLASSLEKNSGRGVVYAGNKKHTLVYFKHTGVLFLTIEAE